MVDSEGQAQYNWGNSAAVMDRHRKKVEGSSERIEGWRKGVP